MSHVIAADSVGHNNVSANLLSIRSADPPRKITKEKGAPLDARAEQALRAALAGPAGGAQAVPEVCLADTHAVAVGWAALPAVRRRLHCTQVSGILTTKRVPWHGVQ